MSSLPLLAVNNAEIPPELFAVERCNSRGSSVVMIGIALLYGTKRDLRGAADVRINGNVPGMKQSFWNVESVPIPVAPCAELTREDIGVWSQS